MKVALIAVDVQRDFIDGSMGAPGRERIIGPLVYLADGAELVVASLDWHPRRHSSFSDEPEFKDWSWPPHCRKGTRGASLPLPISRAADVLVFKGEDPVVEAYSAFDGKTSEGLSLEGLLRDNDIDRVVIGGLCTEYCVRATALDAVRLVGEAMDVFVAPEACAGVTEAGAMEALGEMFKAGVKDWGAV